MRVLLTLSPCTVIRSLPLIQRRSRLLPIPILTPLRNYKNPSRLEIYLNFPTYLSTYLRIHLPQQPPPTPLPLLHTTKQNKTQKPSSPPPPPLFLPFPKYTRPQNQHDANPLTIHPLPQFERRNETRFTLRYPGLQTGVVRYADIDIATRKSGEVCCCGAGGLE
jgi:hypothetical protein